MSRFFCWFVGKKVPPPRMWSIGTYLVVFKMIRWSILMYNFFLWVVFLQLQEVIYRSYFITLSTKSVYIIWVTVTWKFTFLQKYLLNKVAQIYLGTIEIRLYFFSSCIVRLLQMSDLNFGKMPKKQKCALIRENKSFTCRILCACGIVRIILQILYWLA